MLFDYFFFCTFPYFLNFTVRPLSSNKFKALFTRLQKSKTMIFFPCVMTDSHISAVRPKADILVRARASCVSTVTSGVDCASTGLLQCQWPGIFGLSNTFDQRYQLGIEEWSQTKAEFILVRRWLAPLLISHVFKSSYQL